MVFPSASAQLAVAGGLGRETLSACAEPSAVMKPRVRHPTANTARCFLIVPPSGCAQALNRICAHSATSNSPSPNRRLKRRLVSHSQGTRQWLTVGPHRPSSRNPFRGQSVRSPADVHIPLHVYQECVSLNGSKRRGKIQGMTEKGT